MTEVGADHGWCTAGARRPHGTLPERVHRGGRPVSLSCGRCGNPGEAVREEARVLRQPQRIGRYAIRERLGAGGFATVYVAYDPTLDRLVALKVIHPHLAHDATIRQQFVREGRALARVRHPNVVTVFDAGEAEGTAFLAMDLIVGEGLDSIREERGPLPLPEVVEIVNQVASALVAVHAAGLVHRDIKPANILIERGSGRAVLLDLGLARDVASTSMPTAALIGTPTYIAPEQIQADGEVTPQTDVYQLAATVYTLLAGRPPFMGQTTAQVLQAVLHAAPPDLSELRPDLPTGVVAAVQQGLAKDPAHRPLTPQAFAAELRSPGQSDAASSAPVRGPHQVVAPKSPAVSLPGQSDGETLLAVGPRLAYLWKRLASLAIDAIILLVLSFGVAFIAASLVVGVGIREVPAGEGVGGVEGIDFFFVSAVVAWMYYAFFESSSKQGTPGKIALRLVVVGPSGNKLTFLRATARCVARYATATTMMMGFLTVLFTQRRQALHDLISECLVVERT